MSTQLSTYLVPGAVTVGSTASTADEVIGLLADHLETAGVVHPSYRAAVIAREAEMPTGLPLEDGFAVAVPHTDPEHVKTSGIAMATLAEPVEFASMEDPETRLQVRVVFALALRSKDEQIAMLTAIGELLQDSARLRQLSAANSPEDAARLLDAVAS